jgi:large subunit ribosomal protein L10
VQKEDKERVVAELTERLRTAETLIVADYRGLTMPQIDELRSKLLEHGARFTVVKNTLTRRAAEAAGADQLLALLEGPTAVAFLDAEGDAVAVAKALADAARTTRVLELRGGVMQGRVITAGDVEALGALPPVDVLRGQVLGAVAAPLYTIVGLFTAPLQNLIGLIEARIEQLQEGDAGAAPDARAPQDENGSEPQSETGAPPDPAGMAAAGAEQAEAPGSAEDPQTPAADATESVEASAEGTASESE